MVLVGRNLILLSKILGRGPKRLRTERCLHVISELADSEIHVARYKI